MKPITLQNYAEGKWVAGAGGLAELRSAIDGEVVALTSSQGLDFAAMLKHAREEGGPALRALTFHQRALMLKALADALTAWLNRQAASELENKFSQRLDRMSLALGRVERDGHVLLESLALFIRYYLTVSTPVPESHQDAARAQGKARFEQFVEQLGRHLLRGRSLVRDVVEELHPDPMRMGGTAAAAQAQERAS